MTQHTLAVYDADFLAFNASALAEERSIKAIHKSSGREWICKNRTEFWGNFRRKDGGLLKQLNQGKLSPWKPEEFEIIEQQEPKTFNFCAKIIDTQIESIQARLNLPMSAKIGFVTSGDSWRVERSTLLQYKGNRKGLLRPLYLTEAKDYLCRKHGFSVQKYLEVDDVVVMSAYKQPERVVIAVDKDSCGTPVMLFNPDKMDTSLNCDCFGKLFVDDKGNVHGHGRKFFYYQLLAGDKSDNYKPNCFSDIAFSDKSAYNALAGTKKDAEAWQAIVDSYKLMYPEPKIVTGWGGDTFEIDWLYVLTEMVDLAHMLRFEGDKIIVTDVLNKLNIKY